MPLYRDDEADIVVSPSEVAVGMRVVDVSSPLASDREFSPYARSLQILPTTGGAVTVRAINDNADATFAVAAPLFIPAAITHIRASGGSTFRGEIIAYI